jgi:nucleoside-diphosphate-sugar epimerase
MMRDRIENIEQLEELLSEPAEGVVETFRGLEGDILLLGVGGKIGPSIARMAKRASDLTGKQRRVIGVSRFASGAREADLQAHGIETIRCGLLDEGALSRLPDAANVIYLVGTKFGTSGNEPHVWATNTFLPGMVCQRYRQSRIVALSTGNVYALAPVGSGGSVETDAPRPVGEYAMSCLGRERMFEYFSGNLNLPVATIRLNYACELRYGVLVDLVQSAASGEAIPLTMGHFNVIWQGDANAMILQALVHASSPPTVLNVTGPELLNVRQVCAEVARLMGRSVNFTGQEPPTALLSNATLAHRLFGLPRVGASQVLRWVVDWIGRGGSTLGKPTHFERRDGVF